MTTTPLADCATVALAVFAAAPFIALATGPTAATFGVVVGLLVGWDLALKEYEPSGRATR